VFPEFAVARGPSQKDSGPARQKNKIITSALPSSEAKPQNLRIAEPRGRIYVADGPEMKRIFTTKSIF